MSNVWTQLLDIFADVDTTPEQRRSLVNIVAPEMHITEMSAISSLREFRDRGLGIATSDFYEIWNVTRDADSISSDLFYLPKDRQIEEWMLKTGRTDLTGRYGHLASYGLLDDETGTIEYKSFFYDGMSLGTKNEIESLILSAIGEYYIERQGSIVNVNLRRSYINETF